MIDDTVFYLKNLDPKTPRDEKGESSTETHIIIDLVGKGEPGKSNHVTTSVQLVNNLKFTSFTELPLELRNKIW